MNLPFLKVYVRERRADPGLRKCSLGARGLWLEMETLMHEASPYGYLIVGGDRLKITDAADIAFSCGSTDIPLVESYLAELARRGVLAETADGTIFSRDLVVRAEQSERARRNGLKGGNPSLMPLGLDIEPQPIFENEGTEEVAAVAVGVNPPLKLAGATLETRDLDTRIERDAGKPAQFQSEKNQTASGALAGAVDRSDSPSIAFAESFFAAAIASGALAGAVDEVALARREADIASRLLSAHGRDECEVRARRLFEAHLRPPGRHRIDRPPSLAALEAWWDSPQLRGALPLREYGAPRVHSPHPEPTREIASPSRIRRYSEIDPETGERRIVSVPA